MNLQDFRKRLLNQLQQDRKENQSFLDGMETGINTAIDSLMEELNNEAKAAKEKETVNEAAGNEEEGISIPEGLERDDCGPGPTGYYGC